MKDYKELEVWKRSMELAIDVIKLVEKFKRSIPNAIIYQIQKSAFSVPSNIAEGVGRQYKKETIQYLNVGRGSLYELDTQLRILTGINKNTEEDVAIILENLTECLKLLNGFIKYFKSNSKLN